MDFSFFLHFGDKLMNKVITIIFLAAILLIAFVSVSLFIFNPIITINPNPYSATPIPPLPANASCMQDVLPNTSEVVSYSHSLVGCLGLTVGVSSNDTYLNDSVTIFVWLSNLYSSYNLALYGMSWINITNKLNQSVFAVGIWQPCATPCYTTATKIVSGSIYSFEPKIWDVSTSPYSQVPVDGNSTYNLTFQPPLSLYPTLEKLTPPLPIFVN